MLLNWDHRGHIVWVRFRSHQKAYSNSTDCCIHTGLCTLFCCVPLYLELVLDMLLCCYIFKNKVILSFHFTKFQISVPFSDTSPMNWISGDNCNFTLLNYNFNSVMLLRWRDQLNWGLKAAG